MLPIVADATEFGVASLVLPIAADATEFGVHSLLHIGACCGL